MKDCAVVRAWSSDFSLAGSIDVNAMSTASRLKRNIPRTGGSRMTSRDFVRLIFFGCESTGVRGSYYADREAYSRQKDSTIKVNSEPVHPPEIRHDYQDVTP